MSGFDIFDNHHHENFATALVAFAVNHSQEFGLDFVNLVLERANEPKLREPKIEAIREAGISADGRRYRRPDLRVNAFGDGKRYLLLVEAKIGAGEQPDQLADYRKGLSEQKADVKILATLTRDPLSGSAAPDARLFWRDLRPLITNRIEAAASKFEYSFWEELKEYLEETMETFEGFKSKFPDVSGLLRETDLFLVALFRDTMKLGKMDDVPGGMKSACWLPELHATVGFFWRVSRGLQRDQVSKLLVWKDGTPPSTAKALATFENIVSESNHAASEGTLSEFLEQLGSKVRKALEVN